MDFNNIELNDISGDEPESILNSDIQPWCVFINNTELSAPLQYKIHNDCKDIPVLLVSWPGGTADVCIRLKETGDRLLNYWIPLFISLGIGRRVELTVKSYYNGYPVVLNLEKLHDKIGVSEYAITFKHFNILSLICPDIAPDYKRTIEFNDCIINKLLGKPDFQISFPDTLIKHQHMNFNDIGLEDRSQLDVANYTNEFPRTWHIAFKQVKNLYVDNKLLQLKKIICEKCDLKEDYRKYFRFTAECTPDELCQILIKLIQLMQDQFVFGIEVSLNKKFSEFPVDLKVPISFISKSRTYAPYIRFKNINFRTVDLRDYVLDKPGEQLYTTLRFIDCKIDEIKYSHQAFIYEYHMLYSYRCKIKKWSYTNSHNRTIQLDHRLSKGTPEATAWLSLE